MRLPLFAGLLVLAATACRTPKPAISSTVSLDRARAASEQSTTDGASLDSADMIEVRVFQEPDLSGAFRISTDGTIDYPLCGKVKLAGQTSSQTADILTGCLGHRYIKHPQVSVLIREYNSKKVFVFGEVQKPGTFPYENRMSIVQAITLAGGFTKQAAKNSASVTRLISGHEEKIRVPVEDIGTGRERNFLLEPGDIIFVPESFF